MPNKVEETVTTKPQISEIGAVGHISDMVLTVQNEILDRRNITVDQLVFMTRNDGQARGILNSIKVPVKMARAKIKPVEGGEEEAKFIEKNLLGSSEEGGMEIPINKIAGTMSVAVRDNYKIFEKVWEQREGKIWLKKLAYRSTLSTRFKYDVHGNITGALQNAVMGGDFREVIYPLDKIAYYIYNAEENPYMGESDFYPVFYHYDKKHKLYAIAHLAYQLNAVPIRVGKHPKSLKGKELGDFRDSLKSLGTTVAMTIPNDCEIEGFESSRRLTEFMYLLRHHDGMMSRAFLTQFMNLGQEGSGGSFALSTDQSSLFLMALMGLLDDIAGVFNRQVIPQLIDWNFGTKKYPRLVFSPFSDAIRSVILDTFKALLTSRFPQVTPEFVLELEKSVSDELGLSLDYKEIEARILKERAELMKQQKNMEADDSEEDATEEDLPQNQDKKKETE